MKWLVVMNTKQLDKILDESVVGAGILEGWDDEDNFYIEDWAKPDIKERIILWHKIELLQVLRNFGGETQHNSDTGGWCRKSGEQFIECIQCIKDSAIEEITNSKKYK